MSVDVERTPDKKTFQNKNICELTFQEALSEPSHISN